MSKVLVIRKTDKTIHKVPLQNKSALMSYNNRLPDGKKWKFEEMEEEEADKLPFIDESYVTAGEAQVKVKALESESAEKDARIKELEAKLALMNSASPLETAVQKIERINAAESAGAVAEILGDDDRKTVQDAATKKMASFQV